MAAVLSYCPTTPAAATTTTTTASTTSTAAAAEVASTCLRVAHNSSNIRSDGTVSPAVVSTSAAAREAAPSIPSQAKASTSVDSNGTNDDGGTRGAGDARLLSELASLAPATANSVVSPGAGSTGSTGAAGSSGSRRRTRRKARGRRRVAVVRFCSVVRVYLIPRAKDYSESAASTLWWSRDELDRIAREFEEDRSLAAASASIGKSGPAALVFRHPVPRKFQVPPGTVFGARR